MPRSRGILVTASALVKQRDWFFFLVQTESGDLFKVWLDFDGEEVQRVNVKYFDTVPLAVSMVVLKTGFLFVAAESGNQYALYFTYVGCIYCVSSGLYQFQGIGDDDEDVTFLLPGEDQIFFRPRPLRCVSQLFLRSASHTTQQPCAH